MALHVSSEDFGPLFGMLVRKSSGSRTFMCCHFTIAIDFAGRKAAQGLPEMDTQG